MDVSMAKSMASKEGSSRSTAIATPSKRLKDPRTEEQQQTDYE
jgi:hypothetical protein